MEDALRRARKTGFVHDERDGTCYLALHPTYSTSPRLHRCVGLCQMVITLLNFLGFVCVLLGHLLPYCQTRYGMEQWYVWARVWSNGQLLPFIDWRRDLGAVQMAAVMAAVSGLASFVVTAFLPSAWSRVETARVGEDEENAMGPRLHLLPCSERVWHDEYRAVCGAAGVVAGAPLSAVCGGAALFAGAHTQRGGYSQVAVVVSRALASV